MRGVFRLRFPQKEIALWSLGFSRPPAYTVDFWLAYTRFMRDLAAASGHSMRELDRALWQYSKENQPGARP